jgi:hypothetical protein
MCVQTSRLREGSIVLLRGRKPEAIPPTKQLEIATTFHSSQRLNEQVDIEIWQPEQSVHLIQLRSGITLL